MSHSGKVLATFSPASDGENDTQFGILLFQLDESP